MDRIRQSVLQDWLYWIPLMQQTVLLTAVRGPDGVQKYGSVKNLLRWYRRCILVSALDNEVLDNPQDVRGGSFTGPSIQGTAPQLKDHWQSAMNQVVSEYIHAVDAMPLHFHMHLIHAIQILGYKHPDPTTRSWWHQVYRRLVSLFHLHPETEEEMDFRLADNREQWISKSDIATLE